MNKVGKIIKGLRDSREKGQLLQLKQQLDRQQLELDKKEYNLSQKEQQLTIDEVNNNKEVEHFSQTFAAFFNTKKEKDKSILTLSVAGSLWYLCAALQ